MSSSSIPGRIEPPEDPAATSAQLDHVLVVTGDADPTLRFLTEVAGLRLGYRPPFRFPGWWLYAGTRAVVHVVSDAARASGDAPPIERIDHVAFRMGDRHHVCAALRRGGWHYREAMVPQTGEHQIFVSIPGGPRVELVFGAETSTASPL